VFLQATAGHHEMTTEPQRRPRFIPYAEGQQYLYEKYGLPPVSIRRLRDWIVDKKFPAPVNVSPGRKAFTDLQLDRHAEAKLRLVETQAS
jgi:hypothetical protein